MYKCIIRIKGKKKHGTVSSEFLNQLVYRNIGTWLIGKLEIVKLYDTEGNFIKELSPFSKLEVEYSSTEKEFMVAGTIEDNSTDEYIVGKVEVYAKANENMTLVSYFEGLSVSKASDEILKIEYALSILHDDYNYKHAELLAIELSGAISPATYRIVSVKIYAPDGTFIKEITNKVQEQFRSGYENGTYYAEHYVVFRDESTDEYTVGKAEYIDEHGNVYILHEGVNIQKTADVYFVAELMHRQMAV